MTHHILSVTLILMHGVYIIFTYHFFFFGGRGKLTTGRARERGSGQGENLLYPDIEYHFQCSSF